MFSISRFTHAGTSAYTKPVYCISSLTLILAVAFTTLILVGCTSNTPTARKFYIVSMRYQDGSQKDLVGNVTDFLKKDDDGQIRLDTIRVGYRGVCVEGAMEDSNSRNSSTTSISKSWSCARQPSDLGKLTHDPLDLASLSQLILTRITFSTPLWAALMCLVTGFLTLLPSTLSLPFFPSPPPMTRKIAAASSALGCLLLLGLLMLHQVTVSSVSELVAKLTMSVVSAHAGTAIPAFGWSAFALTCIAAASLTALVVVEMAVDSAKRRAEQCVESGLGKVGMDREILRGFRASAERKDDSSSDVGKPFSRPKPAAISLATKLYHMGMKSRAAK